MPIHRSKRPGPDATAYQLRRRAPNGRRSAPAQVCGAELVARDCREGDLDEDDWVVCREGVLPDEPATTDHADAGPAAGAEGDRDGGAGCHVVASLPNDLTCACSIALCIAPMSAARRRQKYDPPMHRLLC